MTIDARPWAKVSIAGHYVDDTPVAEYPVESGVQTVVFQNPETGKSARKQVKIVPGRTSYLKADLR